MMEPPQRFIVEQKSFGANYAEDLRYEGLSAKFEWCEVESAQLVGATR